MRISDWSSDVCSSDLPSANYSSDILRGHAERMQEREPKWRGRTLAMEFWLGTVLVGGHSAANGMAPRRAADYSGAPSGMGPGVRSEERRGGKECVSTCTSRGWRDN